jgi:hypothetical protein
LKLSLHEPAVTEYSMWVLSAGFPSEI